MKLNNIIRLRNEFCNVNGHYPTDLWITKEDLEIPQLLYIYKGRVTNDNTVFGMQLHFIEEGAPYVTSSEERRGVTD
jgi:hypothetical protein